MRGIAVDTILAHLSQIVWNNPIHIVKNSSGGTVLRFRGRSRPVSETAVLRSANLAVGEEIRSAPASLAGTLPLGCWPISGGYQRRIALRLLNASPSEPIRRRLSRRADISPPQNSGASRSSQKTSGGSGGSLTRRRPMGDPRKPQTGVFPGLRSLSQSFHCGPLGRQRAWARLSAGVFHTATDSIVCSNPVFACLHHPPGGAPDTTSPMVDPREANQLNLLKRTQTTNQAGV